MKVAADRLLPAFYKGEIVSFITTCCSQGPGTDNQTAQAPAEAPSLITALATEAASGVDAQTSVDVSHASFYSKRDN